MTTRMINVSDLKDPNDKEGRSYREVNRTKKHNIPLWTLVEISDCGIRMFTAMHSRDCDGTPLYSLSIFSEETEFSHLHHGYPEYSLLVVEVK